MKIVVQACDRNEKEFFVRVSVIFWFYAQSNRSTEATKCNQHFTDCITESQMTLKFVIVPLRL